MKAFKALWGTLTNKIASRQGTIMDEKTVEEVFSEIDTVTSKKQRVSEYLEELEGKIESTEKFETFDKETLQELNLLAGRAKALEEKKQSLKGRLIHQNAALLRLVPYEDKLPEMIKEMQEAEKHKRETENNMYYLKEEREELLEERETLLMGYRFLKGLSIAIIGLITVSLFIAFGMLQVLREAIWGYLTVAAIILVVFLAGMLYAKERIEKGLARNAILQQKAVRYLNKSKIRYFHQMRYLDFQYQKLGVDSAAKLEMYYTRYTKNKNNEKVYLKMNEAISEIEERMAEILKAHEIHVDTTEHVLDWALTPKKSSHLKSLKGEYQKTKEQLEGLVTYEQELWKEVEVMQQDETLNAIIVQKIRKYHQEEILDKDKQSA